MYWNLRSCHTSIAFRVEFKCLNGAYKGLPTWYLPVLPRYSSIPVFFQILTHPKTFPTPSPWLRFSFLSLFFLRTALLILQVLAIMSATRIFSFHPLVILCPFNSLKAHIATKLWGLLKGGSPSPIKVQAVWHQEPCWPYSLFYPQGQI